VQLDWVTVAAQIVNFLVLVWLLQKVLYRPLSAALKAREIEVNRRLQQADAAREQAEAEAEAHRAARATLAETQSALLEETRQEAAALRSTLTQTAQAEVAARRAAWASQLQDEKAAFLERLRERAGNAFVTLARRALAEMADQELEAQLARVFARRLEALEPVERTRLIAAIDPAQQPRILSAFSLPEPVRKEVLAAVTAILGAHEARRVVFEEDGGLECGIVLAVASRHLGWSLGEYLDVLERDVARLMQPGADPEEVS
jgi:F-type H+-transporting ATPase subunit b